MRCPYCGNNVDKVLDTRPTDEGSSVRRRRECLQCQKRFTTYETVETQPMIIIKKNDSRQPFEKSKIMIGLLRACEKRPVDIKTIENMTDKIEQALKSTGKKEIESSEIGLLIMEKLKAVDLIAYVRFVSVYKEFNCIDSFIDELDLLIKKD